MGWALLRGFYELMFALHWQSPDEGHVNVRVLVYFLENNFISKLSGGVNRRFFCIRKPRVRRGVQKSLSDEARHKNSF
jgi:hypothetical protein